VRTWGRNARIVVLETAAEAEAEAAEAEIEVDKVVLGADADPVIRR
jgi:hypothetical protein